MGPWPGRARQIDLNASFGSAFVKVSVRVSASESDSPPLNVHAG